jgi:T5SS/PEP-CTERM-associated repeat protein
MKLQTRLLPSLATLALAASLGSAPLHASPPRSTWTAGSGTFSDSSNWDTGSVPGSGDIVRFAGTDPLTISLNAPAAILALEVRTDTQDESPGLTFDLAGGELRIGDENDNQTAFFRLNTTRENGPRTVAITGGTLWCPVVSISTNPNPDTPPCKILVTANGRFETGRYLYVGNKGEGILEIQNEGTVETRGYLRVAEGDDSKGTVRVSGPNALLLCGSIENPRWGLAFIGGRGEGNLLVENGGRVEGLLLQAARNSGDEPAGKGRGKIHVSGSGSTVTCEQLFIGGGRANLQRTQIPVRDGIAELRLDGGASTQASEFRLFPGSTLAIDPASSLSIAPLKPTTNPVAVLEPGSTLEVLLADPATQAPVRVSGLAEIEGAKLQLANSGSSPAGIIPLLDYSEGDLSGTFEGLPDGAEISSPDGRVYTIDYGLGGSRTISLKSK